MTTMFPIPVWQQGMTQPSVPVNDAMLRQEVLARGATSIISAPPGSPIDGQVHILGAAPSGAWAGFAQHDVVMWRSGAWVRFAPFLGWVKQVGTEVRRYSGTAWEIGAEPSGAAAAAVAAHVAAADPHPQYLTPAEAGAAYSPLGHTHPASQISDSTVAGRAMVTAADAAAQRTLLDVAPLAAGTAGGQVAAWNVAAGEWRTSTEIVRRSPGFYSFEAPAGGQPALGLAENDVLRGTLYYDPLPDEIRIAVYDSFGGYAGDAIRISRTTREVSDWRGSIRDTPVNVQNAAYTFTAADRGRKVLKSGTAAISYTIPVGLPVGMTTVARNMADAGALSIARTVGVVLRMAGSGTDADRTIAPWGEALLHHEAQDQWVISGTGVT